MMVGSTLVDVHNFGDHNSFQAGDRRTDLWVEVNTSYVADSFIVDRRSRRMESLFDRSCLHKVIPCRQPTIA